jgi:hypothetical protein
LEGPAFRRINQSGYRHAATGTVWTRDACDRYWFWREGDRYASITKMARGWRVKVEARESEDHDWQVQRDVRVQGSADRAACRAIDLVTGPAR